MRCAGRRGFPIMGRIRGRRRLCGTCRRRPSAEGVCMDVKVFGYFLAVNVDHLRGKRKVFS